MAVVDDHELYVDSLVHLVRQQEDLEVVGSARSFQECLDRVDGWAADVVVLDRLLTDGDVLLTLPDLVEASPTSRIVVLSAHGSETARRQALAQGAAAYVGKEASVGELLDAVRGAGGGRPGVAPEAGSVPVLTRREAHVLRLMAAGLTNPAIAVELGLDRTTVRHHVAHLSAKLGAHSKLEAVVRARRAGLLC